MSFHLSECANFSVTFSSKTLHLPFVISGMLSFVDFQRRYERILLSLKRCSKYILVIVVEGGVVPNMKLHPMHLQTPFISSQQNKIKVANEET